MCPHCANLLSAAQLSYLVQWGFADLEEASGHMGTFALLRAILRRRIVLPEVYDVVVRIQEFMIKCQVGFTLCSMSFIADWIRFCVFMAA